MIKKDLSMKTNFQKIKSNFIPIALLAVFLGAAQDLLTPLLAIGIKGGVILLGLAVIIFFIPEHSRFGQALKNMTDNWKLPLIVSLFTLSGIVLLLSVFTEQSEKENGILASNIAAFATIQSSLLGIETELAETKARVEENLEVTKSVKQDTTEIEKVTAETFILSSKTLNNTDTIVKNTQKNAYEELSVRGLKPNDRIDFIKSVKDSSWDEFVELMDIYKGTNFNLLTEVTMPDAVLEHDYNNNLDKGATFYLPSKVLLFNVLTILKTDIKRLDYLVELFDIDVALQISPISSGYARNQFTDGMPYQMFMQQITHPQIDIASGDDLGTSLISHRLEREQKLTDKRGAYHSIHFMASMNYPEYLEWHLQKGADINARTHTGYTPLAIALEKGHLEMAELLIKHGARLKAGGSVAVEIALLSALAHNNANPSDGSTERYYTVKENPYFMLLKNNGEQKINDGIRRSVTKVYEAYYEYELKTYGFDKPTKGTVIYKSYIDWLNQQQAM
jgi:hypothetical protein